MARALIFLSFLALLSLAVAPHSTSARMAQVEHSSQALSFGHSASSIVQAGPSCAAIEEVGTIPGNFLTVSISGTLLYAAGYTAFAIFDASNPISPTLLGSFALQAKEVSQMVVGSFAYLLTLDASNQALLQIIDVSDPLAPSLRSTYPISSSYFSLYVSDHLAYIPGGYDDTFLIIDVDDPSNPVLRMNYNIGSPVFDIQVIGNIAYVATLHGLRVMNVGDPLQPREIGNLPALFNTDTLKVAGSRVYAAGSGGPTWVELSIFDVSNPTKPSLSGSYTGRVYEQYHSLEYRNFLLYAVYSSTRGSASSGVDILNVLDPTSPYVCAEYPLTAFDLELAGDLAYVPGGAIHILHITPTIVFSHAFLPVARR